MNNGSVKMNVILKNLTFMAVFAATLCAASAAQAQMFSGRGVDSRAMGEVSCIAEIERLEITVQYLEAQRDAMIDCNEDGMVFAGVGEPGADADGCVDLTPLTAVWLDTSDNVNPSNPDTLHFVDDFGNQQPVPAITVIRGNDGANATCPTGYDPL